MITKNTFAFQAAVKYVKWLDKAMNAGGYELGQLPLHYCFNSSVYDTLMYYCVADSGEIFYYTPHSYDFVGVSHTVDDTYSFLYKLIHDEFGYMDYIDDSEVAF